MNKIYKLDSGLRWAFHNLPHTKSVAIGVYVGVGSENESKELNGISHLIEHMLFKGTETRTAFAIADELESLGVQVNAFTAKNMTSFYTISIDEHAEKCMELLSDMFFNSKLDAGELAKEKGVICEEISSAEDDPEDVCYDGIASARFGDTGLGRTILGPAENVRSFTPENLREYMHRYYTPQNTVISIAGNISASAAENLIKKYFDSKFGKDYPEKPTLTRVTPVKDGRFLKVKPVEQSNICFAFPCFAYGDDKQTLIASLISNVFGGGMSSRLFQSVREKLGLCYSVYSLTGHYRDNGSFVIFVGTNPSTACKAIKAIRKEVLEFVAEGITEQEFSKGREQLKSSIVLGSESSVSLMRLNGRNAVLGNTVFDVERRVNTLNAITMSDVNDAIKFIFDFGEVSSSYVGPQIDCDILEVFKGGNNA